MHSRTGCRSVHSRRLHHRGPVSAACRHRPEAGDHQRVRSAPSPLRARQSSAARSAQSGYGRRRRHRPNEPPAVQSAGIAPPATRRPVGSACNASMRRQSAAPLPFVRAGQARSGSRRSRRCRQARPRRRSRQRPGDRARRIAHHGPIEAAFGTDDHGVSRSLGRRAGLSVAQDRAVDQVRIDCADRLVACPRRSITSGRKFSTTRLTQEGTSVPAPDEIQRKTWDLPRCASADQIQTIRICGKHRIQAELDRGRTSRQIDNQTSAARAGQLTRQDGCRYLRQAHLPHRFAEPGQLPLDEGAWPRA